MGACRAARVAAGVSTVAVALALFLAAPARAESPALPDPTPSAGLVSPAGAPADLASAGDSPTGESPSYYAGGGDRPRALRAETNPIDTIVASLTGDVYAEGRWRPLPLSTFFTEGWLESWAGAPAGREGLTPRHGWLGAFDGVFYRLWVTTFTYQNRLNTSFGGNRYLGLYQTFLLFSRRFEVLLNVPFVVSNGTAAPRRGATRRSSAT